jgi:hypothetical protein
MAKFRLTNNSDETDISSLLSGDSIFTIPYFQRAYKWKTERLNQLNLDILNVIDETGMHFLGAIIVHARRSNPSDPDLYDVIDGQQRITTLFIYLAATVKTLCNIKEITEAKGLFLKYLVIGRDTGTISNIKLHPCKEDRAQLNQVFEDILSNKPFSDSLEGFKIKYMFSIGAKKGTLLNNYRSALRFMKTQVAQGGTDRLRALYTAILSFMSVVQIDVNDPTNGPKIFDSLNSRQEPMTVGDLIRNEIFSRITEENTAESDRIYEQCWQPFYKHFNQENRNFFDAYFFPYGLIHNPNLKKSEIYNALREKWSDIDDPEKIISDLRQYQNAFVDISCRTNYQNHTKNIHQLFCNLHDLNAPNSVYPFLMKLSNATRDNVLSENEAAQVLEVVESFLVRRAACGHEPTGLHAVFKRLWVDCDNKPNRNSVIEQIGKHKTVVWPTTEEFKKAIETRPLYGAGITKYLILEYDRTLGGDQPDNNPWIEHILPDTPSKPWFDIFTQDEHQTMKDLLANLIPLSGEMNRSLSNKPYKEKRDKYLKDSMFKSAREFAKSCNDWKPASLLKRAKDLSKWAETRWIY